MLQVGGLGFKIALTSFLILFLELALIRYLPAHITYLGYFANLVLVASLFGIGLGLLLARGTRDYFKWTLIPLLLLLLLAQVVPVVIDINDKVQVFYGLLLEDIKPISPLVVLPIIFIFVTVIFAGLGDRLGKLFRAHPEPLTAYFWDLIGSLVGIAFFSALAWISLPPAVWFGVFALGYLLAFRTGKEFTGALLLTATLAALVVVSVLDFGNYQFRWTPYYRLTLIPDAGELHIIANGIVHQQIMPGSLGDDRKTLFGHFARSFPIDKTLIIGSGGGADITAVLAAGAKEVTAVEIDPGIQKVGMELNPDQPYQDPRVRVVIDDGRQFLKNSTEKYDFIVYALTDSLVLTSANSSLRLENYLYTQEALREVKSHLKPNGHFSAYNYYRTVWLADRLALMMRETFGQVYSVRDVATQPSDKIFLSANSTSPPGGMSDDLPSDDWPFFYLSTRSIPSLYWLVFGIISAAALACLFLVWRKTKLLLESNITRAGVFFSLGAAFSLIETKSITELALLFGSTWGVNAIAFAGILVAVLAAVVVSRYIKMPLLLSGTLLVVALLVQMTIPVEALAVPNYWSRAGLATIYFFMPIFLANLIFSKLFAETNRPEIDLSANILGLFVGGMIEYLSLVYGFAALALPALGLYLAALILSSKLKAVS